MNKRAYYKRRAVLQALSAGGAMASLGLPLSALAAGATLQPGKITDRLSLIGGAGGNVVAFTGEQGVTLVDSGSAGHSEQLLAAVRELAGELPVSTLFNTHWHEDHTGGNEALHAIGAEILAHENTRLWLGADFDVEWRDWTHDPRPAAALPDTTFYDSGKKDLGGETVHYLHYPRAHTDGDIALLFPDSNVLVAGGLLHDGSYPITDIATGGWIGGLIEANAAMLELADAETIIVPDRGPARSRADLQAQHDMLADLYETMKELARKGYSGHDMLEAGVTAPYDAQWGDPREFVLETYRGMWAHTYDMGGFI